MFKRGRGENRIVPTDRRSKAEWIVPPGQEAGAEPDEIVLAEPVAQHLHLGLKPARVLERLGKLGDARSISLIAIHTHDIPQAFPEAALDEAERARGVRLGSRTDLRDVKLITIDGADARDFDDAVFAEPDPDQAGGFRLIVAIADVAHYVRPGSALDQRGRTSAATASIFPTASCRCCRRRCRTAGAACARTRIAAACSSRCGSTAPAARPATGSAAA